MTLVLATGRNAPVLSRRPERLAIEGYRHWLNGFRTGSIACWERGYDVCADEVGAAAAARLAGELTPWVRETCRSTRRDLDCFPYGSGCLCRDECLVLAMLAAHQHGDAATADLAARHLVGDGDPGRASAAAGVFARALGEADQRLLPIPATVVADVAARPPAAKLS